MRLESSVFSSEEFKTFSESNVMLAHVTTHIEGRKYDGLLSEKKGRGWPYIVVLSPEGDLIGKAEGKSVEAFTKMMTSAAEFVAISSKAEKTLDDEIFLFQHAINEGSLTFAQAKEKAASFKDPTAEQQTKIDAGLTDLEIVDALGKPKSREEHEKLAEAAGKKFVEMWKAGREPNSAAAYDPFYMLIMKTADAAGDPALYEKALGKLRERHGEKEGAARFFEQKEKRLEELKAAAGDADAGDDEEGNDEDGM